MTDTSRRARRASSSEIETAIPVVRDDPRSDSLDAHGGEVILVVEPDTKARRLLCDALESFGYSIFEAEDAERAHQALGHLRVAPDLVVGSAEVQKELSHDPRLLRSLVLDAHRPFAHQQLGARVREALSPAAD